jgi:hypothetical protein
MSAQILLQGGFLTSKEVLEKVAKPIEARTDGHVNVITFSDQRRYPDLLSKLQKEAGQIVTHSAGILSVDLALTRADVVAVAPPSYPVSRRALALRSFRATRQMSQDAKAHKPGVDRYNKGMMDELVKHAWSNLWPFIKGDFSHFDGVNIIQDPKLVPCDEIGNRILVLMKDDLYFPFVEQKYEYPEDIVVLSGSHDRLLIDPQRTVSEIFEHLDTQRTTGIISWTP